MGVGLFGGASTSLGAGHPSFQGEGRLPSLEPAWLAGVSRAFPEDAHHTMTFCSPVLKTSKVSLQNLKKKKIIK
jgi:hypothetical protein